MINSLSNVRRLLQLSAWLLLFMPRIANAQQSVFDGGRSAWHEGFDRYDYIMDEQTLVITPYKAPEGENYGVKEPPPGKRRCIIVAPRKAAAGNPWSWRGCYWDHQPQSEVELLKRGFHIAYISASATLRPGKEWDAWYRFLVEKGLSPKPCFTGMSRGGEFEYTWATAHPDKVTCIYADNPAVNKDILMKLGALAGNNVPLLHVCGSLDPLYLSATAAIEAIYPAFGGRISVVIKEGAAHHPHSLHNPALIADFMEQSVKEIQPTPGFIDGAYTQAWYTSTKTEYKFVAAENAWFTFRGPLFTEGYHRYTFQLPGVESFITVIAPEKAAAGTPWVFRATWVKPDAAVDQALLARGYYIVTGPVPYNFDGPQLTQWNLVYQHLTAKGFSSRPVIEGEGAAAGEAIAWAAQHPGNVACIYAENPVLKTIAMSDVQPLDQLAPLAKAGVPVMLVAGSNDPALSDNTRTAEKRYRQAGGKITVIERRNEAHFLLQQDAAAAVRFITASTHTEAK